MIVLRNLALPFLALLAMPPALRAQGVPPETVAVPGARAALTLQAAGAQIHECRPDAAGGLAWRFREPVATLLQDGTTVGRHFAGPAWQLADGSLLTARATGSAPGATAADIPLLRLEPAAPGTGRFAAVVAIQRLATQGGVLTGPCTTAGALRPVPYTADYVFLVPAG
ncbi:DUF3455 domain-containing protein [Paracraurococcus ruber]|uniref:DUF3455 domain-containing protein n=1 Tax=Paracraurococcus ruber TaxID=77675 RepID=A0ABS1D2P8_9PROT|nr:DUF3455 domain-containing protein [Paracraurococcus ruber]MBK1661118.1 hypothetical protein [Paracraurococcus ruber]TDG31648.1 DUF3455 domain-containing protein [Paracraurococcus ruber]